MDPGPFLRCSGFLFIKGCTVVPNTDLAGYQAAGYPANKFSGYRISGSIGNEEFFLMFFFLFFFIKTNQHFWTLLHSYFVNIEKIL